MNISSGGTTSSPLPSVYTSELEHSMLWDLLLMQAQLLEATDKNTETERKVSRVIHIPIPSVSIERFHMITVY